MQESFLSRGVVFIVRAVQLAALVAVSPRRAGKRVVGFSSIAHNPKVVMGGPGPGAKANRSFSFHEIFCGPLLIVDW